MKERADEMQSLLAVPLALRTPAQLRRFQELAAQSSDSWASLRRKRKRRRRRKKTSKSSSSCGHARRRQRQWHARYAGFPGFIPLRAVFPSVVVRPAMLGITAVQWHVQGWFCWLLWTSFYVPCGCRQASGQVGMVQKYNHAVCWFYW